MAADGKLYLVCSAHQNCALLECHDVGSNVWSTRPLVTSADDPAADVSMAMGAATHGQMLLVADYTMHRVVVFTNGKLTGTLVANTLRQPCAVATDGSRAFVSGAGMVHEFDLLDGACTAAWPTTSPDTGPFECDHGLAVHRDSVFVVDRRGSQVHVFNTSGTHLRSWGGVGEAAGCFRQPWGVAICYDHVLVSEQSGKRVQIFTLTGMPVGQLCPDPDGCGDLAAVWADEQNGRVLIADWDKRCVRVMQLLSQAHSPQPGGGSKWDHGA